MGSGSYTLLVDWNNDGDFTDANDDITSDVLSKARKVMGKTYLGYLAGAAGAVGLPAAITYARRRWNEAE